MKMIKRKHVFKEHNWLKTEDGDINMWAYEEDFCNGPRCEQCATVACIHCEPEWEAEAKKIECSANWLECPKCHTHQIRDTDHFCCMCGTAIEFDDAAPVVISYDQECPK